MITRLQRLVEGFLAALVLLLLHSLHGATLLLALFVHLSHHLRQAYASAASRRSDGNHATRSKEEEKGKILPCKVLEADKAIWRARKIPKCLAVIFVPAARGHFSLSRFRYVPWDEQDVYAGMAHDVSSITVWAKELGVETLLLYDENALLKKYSKSLQSAIKRQQADVNPHDNNKDLKEINKESQASSSFFTISENTFVSQGLRISLLAREDGKDHVAAVTRGISKGIQAGFIAQEEVDVDFVQEKIYSSLCPEPDLLIVLGGLHLRLRGFPPWHTRLCEIYHDSSLSLLGPPRLRYAAFRRAMDNYAGCEQRLGR